MGIQKKIPTPTIDKEPKYSKEIFCIVAPMFQSDKTKSSTFRLRQGTGHNRHPCLKVPASAIHGFGPASTLGLAKFCYRFVTSRSLCKISPLRKFVYSLTWFKKTDKLWIAICIICIIYRIRNSCRDRSLF